MPIVFHLISLKVFFEWSPNLRKQSRASINIYCLSQQVQPDGVLLISNAQVSDSGEYMCIAENELGMGDDFVSLEVGVPPKMIHTPRGTYMPQLRI
jgi:hypothetical protein